MAHVSLSTEGVWRDLHANLRSSVDKLHAWIYQTTRRAIADFYRSPSHHREVATGSAEDVADDVGLVDPEGTDESARVSSARALKPLISTLAAPDQQALQMVEFEGLTQVEAAARLGLSVSGLKSRVQRARSHLRGALDDCCRIALDRRGGVISYETKAGACDSCAPGTNSDSDRS
jgi:RNA polymerase sigma-70 factor (ECF subfamily)